MPKGQSPSAKMSAEYQSLNRQLDRIGKDYSLLSKIRRKVVQTFGRDDGQHAMNPQYHTLLRRIEKIEASRAGEQKRTTHRNVKG